MFLKAKTYDVALSSDSDSISWNSSDSESFDVKGFNIDTIAKRMPGSSIAQKRDSQKWRDLEEKFKYV